MCRGGGAFDLRGWGVYMLLRTWRPPSKPARMLSKPASLEVQSMRSKSSAPESIETMIDAYWQAIAVWKKAARRKAELAKKLPAEIMRSSRVVVGRNVTFSSAPRPIYAHSEYKIRNSIENHKAANMAMYGRDAPARRDTASAAPQGGLTHTDASKPCPGNSGRGAFRCRATFGRREVSRPHGIRSDSVTYSVTLGHKTESSQKPRFRLVI